MSGDEIDEVGQACAVEGCNHAATRGWNVCREHLKNTQRYRGLERALRRAGNLLRRDRISEQDFADYLVERSGGGGGDDEVGGDACYVGLYFEQVWEIIRKLRLTSKRPPCAECGRAQMQDTYRANSRYCSASCRQKAYRKRALQMKPTKRAAKRNGSPVRYASSQQSERNP
jgi:hypothetical protein